METRYTGALTKNVVVSMTLADLDMVGDRLSPTMRRELRAAATEQATGTYDVAMTETRARDLASKGANLGLIALATKIQQALDGLAV